MCIAREPLLILGVLGVCALLHATSAFAQAQTDDDMTLVVGTHFVTASTTGVSPRTRFTSDRIPASAFNKTDTCIDQRAVEAAQEYFTALGSALTKAEYYYFVPGDALAKAAASCESLYGAPPGAWSSTKTEVIAFGRMVPTAEAAALEESIR